jgi:TetR/AcrR family tetracycline transcriptional repressor
MARKQAAETATREHLTRPRVVAAALAIVDRDGLDGLTMRALGRELGVDPMAAYHWFPNKGAILQGVSEAILSEMPLPEPVAEGAQARPWRETGMDMARQFRAALLRHPNALPVASTQPVMTPRGFELVERTAAVMVAGGITPGAAIEAINVVAAFVIGLCVVEAGVTPGSEPIPQEEIMATYSGIDTARFPTLASAMVEAAELLADDERQYEQAARALILGLDASFRERGLVKA